MCGLNGRPDEDSFIGCAARFVYRHTFNATDTSCATATLQRLRGSLKAEGFREDFFLAKHILRGNDKM